MHIPADPIAFPAPSRAGLRVWDPEPPARSGLVRGQRGQFRFRVRIGGFSALAEPLPPSAIEVAPGVSGSVRQAPFRPGYCPHLNPIERLWGLMHKSVTHNRCYATYNGFCDAVLGFLRRDVPSGWNTFCDILR